MALLFQVRLTLTENFLEYGVWHLREELLSKFRVPISINAWYSVDGDILGLYGSISEEDAMMIFLKFVEYPNLEKLIEYIKHLVRNSVYLNQSGDWC